MLVIVMMIRRADAVVCGGGWGGGRTDQIISAMPTVRGDSKGWRVTRLVHLEWGDLPTG